MEKKMIELKEDRERERERRRRRRGKEDGGEGLTATIVLPTFDISGTRLTGSALLEVDEVTGSGESRELQTRRVLSV